MVLRDEGHVGVDAGTGYAHSVTATAANVHDLDEAPHLVRTDDRCVYADYGYQGAEKRPEIAGDEHLAKVEWRIAARKGALKTMPTTTGPWSHARRACARRSSIIPDRQARLRVHQDPTRDREEPQPLQLFVPKPSSRHSTLPI